MNQDLYQLLRDLNIPEEYHMEPMRYSLLDIDVEKEFDHRLKHYVNKVVITWSEDYSNKTITKIIYENGHTETTEDSPTTTAKTMSNGPKFKLRWPSNRAQESKSTNLIEQLTKQPHPNAQFDVNGYTRERLNTLQYENANEGFEPIIEELRGYSTRDIKPSQMIVHDTTLGGRTNTRGMRAQNVLITNQFTDSEQQDIILATELSIATKKNEEYLEIIQLQAQRILELEKQVTDAVMNDGKGYI